MNLKTNIANSGNYSKGRTKKILYLVVHYTANNGDTDEGNGKYFASRVVGASAHYFVDEDSVTQAVRDTDTAWHCESRGMALKCGCRNSNSIGIEMCSDKVNGVYVITADTVTNTVELVKLLMKKYNIPVENVLRHYDVCGKNCPEPFVREAGQWVAFKKRLEEEEMVEQSKIKINGTLYLVDRILKDGANYIKVRDLEKAGFVISNEGSMAVITTKK